MDRWREEPDLRLTVVALAAGVVLVAAGTAGLAASLPLAGATLVLALPLRGLGDVAVGTAWDRLDPHAVVADLWLGPPVAALVLLAVPDATPGEVQALGGLVGLVGMANYFLRPVYHLAWALVSRLTA